MYTDFPIYLLYILAVNHDWKAFSCFGLFLIVAILACRIKRVGSLLEFN
jgi:hypothetical protein